MLYLQRNYVELAILFIKLKMKTDYFLYRFELSKYEFKIDLERLKQMAKTFGVEIRCDEEYISLEIINRDKYNEYHSSFFSFYHMNRYIFNDNDIMISLLISVKLLTDELFSIDEFSELIGYSKSNLRKPIKMARNFIKSHGIEILNRPYYGLYIKGNEFYIRKCLCSTYMKLVPEIFITDTNNGYLVQHVDYSQAYNIINDYIEKKGYDAFPDDRKNVIYYLAVTKSRINIGKYINEIPSDDKIINVVKENEYLNCLAVEMFNLLDIPLYEKEIHAMTIVLLDNNFSIDYSKEYVSKLYENEYNELRSSVYKNLYSRYGFNISAKDYTEGIDEELVSIIIKQHTGSIDKILNKALGNTPNVYSFPLIYFINNSICRVIREYYHNDNISPAVTENIADIVYYYIDALPYFFRKYKLAIVSGYNQYTPKLIKDKILKDIDNNYFESIDIINGVSVLSNNIELIHEYDLLLSDINIKNYEKTILYSEINSSYLKFENYLRLHRNMCACLAERDFYVRVNDIEVKDEGEVIKRLAVVTKYSEDRIKKGIYYGYILKENIIMYIPIKDEDSSLQIGEFSQTVIIKNRKVSRYQIYKGKITERNAKVINVILHEFITDPLFMEELKVKPSIETINEIVNMIIK